MKKKTVDVLRQLQMPLRGQSLLRMSLARKPELKRNKLMACQLQKRIREIIRSPHRDLLTIEGIRLFSAYVSDLRLTKSIHTSYMRIRAVSKCFDWSGLLCDRLS